MRKKNTKLAESVKKTKFETIRNFVNENQDTMFIVASPFTDEVYMGFNGQEALYKFPDTGEITQNVVFQLLSNKTFAGAVDAFLTAIIKGLGINSEGGVINDKASASFLGLVDGFLFNSVVGKSVKGKRVSGDSLQVDKKKVNKK